MKFMRLRQFLRKARLLYPKPVGFTGVVLGLWFLVRSWFGHLFPLNDNQVAAQAAEIIAVFHAMIAARVYSKTTDERDALYESLDRGDYIRFVRLRDKRIEWYTHWMLATFSTALLISVSIIHYDSTITGGFTVAATALIVSVYWQAAMVADDPIKSGWFDEDGIITNELREMTMEQALAKMRDAQPSLYLPRFVER